MSTALGPTYVVRVKSTDLDAVMESARRMLVNAADRVPIPSQRRR